MVGSHYSRRSTLLGVTSIALILLISIALLYHQSGTEIRQPIFEHEPEHITSAKGDSRGGTSQLSSTEHAASESSSPLNSDEEIWAKPFETKTATHPTMAAVQTPSLSLAQIEEMCRREGLLEQKTWKFDPARDSANYGLEAEQCESAFPDMYHEIYRAQKWRQENHGNITEGDLDLGWKDFGVLRAMIYERQLFIVETKCIEIHGHPGGAIRYDIRRAIAMLGSIHRAISAYHGPIPNIEFSLSVEDIADAEEARKPLWVMTRRAEEEYQWMMPDFGYWSWDMEVLGSYEQVRQEMADKVKPFETKRAAALWRGAKLNKIREDLLNITRDKPWADVREIIWGSEMNDVIRMADHCQYQYLIQTEGNSYSGRGKYLLNCDSVVVMHKRIWMENYEHLMIGEGVDQNVVFVRDDFEDLPEKMETLLGNPQLAKKIADNSARQFRDKYLTPAAQACYWRKLFHAWRDISFEPSLYADDWQEDSQTGEMKVTRRFRGVPYETYM
ncbi:MAG: hypothetical protein Q9165_000468 [Trypethelium subeluteriae]